MLLCVCPLVDHSWRQNSVVRKTASVAHEPFGEFVTVVLPHYDVLSRYQSVMYKTYTTGQLRIKTVFQNNNKLIQDSFHAFLFISRVFIKSSKFNSWGVRNIQKSTWHSRSRFQHVTLCLSCPVNPVPRAFSLAWGKRPWERVFQHLYFDSFSYPVAPIVSSAGGIV